MFEKYAEEYAKEKYSPKTDIFIVAVADDAFKDGAEFGYNKCFEQIRKIVNEDTRLDCIIPELLRLKESKYGKERT